MKKAIEIAPSYGSKHTVEEVMAEVYEDQDIQSFLMKYQDYMDDEMLRAGNSTLREYLKFRDDPEHKVKLILSNEQIATTYIKRDTALQQKYRDRVPSKLIYDASTRKYKGFTMQDYETNMDNIKAYEIAKFFIANYKYGDKSKGIWLCGNFGIGKIFLMGAMATELNKRKVGVNFVSAAQLMNDMYDIIRRNPKDNSVQNQVNHLQKAEVLIIDDLGTEKLTRNNVIDVLYTILKYRGEHNKPTFITSNLTKDQYYLLLKDAGPFERLDIGRLKEQLDVLTKEEQMIGQNRRNKA